MVFLRDLMSYLMEDFELKLRSASDTHRQGPDCNPNQMYTSISSMNGKAISLKALVDKKNNRVIFVESDNDFVDVLLSFLTMPMGTIIRLTRNLPPTTAIGCINNIYASIENLDVMWLRSEACKTMLLHPRNAVEAQCKGLKLKIDDAKPLSYFCCWNSSCTTTAGHKLLNRYKNARCCCGQLMLHKMDLNEEPSVSDARNGVFLKGATRYLVTDNLQLIPASTSSSLSLLAKFGFMDASAIEERNFVIGVKEVFSLLKCSLVSKTPFTQILLQRNAIPNFRIQDLKRGSITHQVKEQVIKGRNDIESSVKLVISKSKKMVCYAEATQHFVDLLFSFLTTPLGHAAKEMRSGFSKGCINNLYNSVQQLDAEEYLNSKDQKNILLSPKLAPGFGYKNHPLGLEEARNQKFYYVTSGLRAFGRLTTEYHPWNTVAEVMDPKSAAYKEAMDSGGFVIGKGMFTVTDNLFITPISPVSGLSILNSLKVPFSDIEERVVHLGKNEARRLLVTSFSSESALTDFFLREEPKDAFVLKAPKQEN